MKKLVFGAAALTMTGTAFATGSDLASLDQDIQALSASVQSMEDTGIDIGGRIRVFYENSSDIDGGVNAQGDVNDLGGFALYNARLYARGTTTQDIGYHLETDFAGNGTMTLVDAYLDIPVGAEITTRVGQFRAFVLQQSLYNSGDLFFADRSAIAGYFSGRSTGVAATGDFDAFNWAVTIQNGGDAIGDDLFFAVRGQFNFTENGTDLVEGAYGASEELEATAGIAYYSDEATDDADGIAVEGIVTTNQFSAHAAILAMGDGASASNVENVERFGMATPLTGDATPFVVGGTFMLTDATSEYGAWEIGARFQDLDDAADTSIFDVGANYYADGHNMKYIIMFTSVSSDDDSMEADLIRVGVQSRF